MDSTTAETLSEVRDQSMAMWSGAVKNRHSPLHTPVVTTAAGGVPCPRIMVLRDVAPDCARFRFHTDQRSQKVQQLGDSAPVAILGYDPDYRVQLIVRGVGHIEHQGDMSDAAWAASAPSSRRCYLAAHAPGTPVDSPTAGLPDHLLTRAPTIAESQPGRENFSVLMVEVREIEWLKLTSCGNRRAVFTRSDDDWNGRWITP